VRGDTGLHGPRASLGRIERAKLRSLRSRYPAVRAAHGCSAIRLGRSRRATRHAQGPAAGSTHSAESGGSDVPQRPGPARLLAKRPEQRPTSWEFHAALLGMLRMGMPVNLASAESARVQAGSRMLFGRDPVPTAPDPPLVGREPELELIE